MDENPSFFQKFKIIILGRAKDPQDSSIFHKLSLIAFFAWIGLGADGLSSSCYGPSEAFITLGRYHYLGIFVGLGTALTILVISRSYSQTIEVFPSGGGGYLVASKLHSPVVGMVSGCALLIDYMLTITVSIASGADALFSFLPPGWHSGKLYFAMFGVIILILMNMRGVKESVFSLVPVFLIFVITHLFVLIVSIVTHPGNFSQIIGRTSGDINLASSELGFFGMIFLILRAYSMGAGTFTGIEAVSNGLPILREPKVHTAKQTMRYMAISLAVTALGLIFAYLLFGVQAQPGKTLNAIVFEKMTSGWGAGGYIFVMITLVSEAAILFVAAQAGFIDGPRILSNMALDRWMPSRFSMLSDRLVAKNGILLMGGAALVLMLITDGRVDFLIVLYSINVFVTFTLTESGMVRYWLRSRGTEPHWKKKLSVNATSLLLAVFILVTVVVMKFFEGGWITIMITGSLVMLSLYIKRHYNYAGKMLKRLDHLTEVSGLSADIVSANTDLSEPVIMNPKDKTAVLLVNGFNGLGLHTLFSIIRMFSGIFKNFIFLQVGMIDAGNFKGVEELENLKSHTAMQINNYVTFMRKQGYYAEGITSLATDVVDELERIAPQITERFPDSIFFGGQLVFKEETFLTRLLHNYIVFSVQKRFYQKGLPFMILPVSV